jgi:acyl-CoA thioester hydrolase
VIIMDINKFKHRISIKVRFCDLDAMGHVNNTAYLSYLEEARLAYYNQVLNIDTNKLEFNAVVARIEIDYLEQIRLGDNVEVYTRTGKIGNKSSDVEHLIVIVDNQERKIAARAMTKLVSFDYKNNKTIPVPEKDRATIEMFESSELEV